MTLKDWFGPGGPMSMPELRKTSWPHVEEHIRPILDCFQELAGCEPGHEPKGFVRQQWIAGARAWYSVFGEDTRLLRLAVEYMQLRELIITSPRSCISVATDIRKREPDPNYWRNLAKRLEEDDED